MVRVVSFCLYGPNNPYYYNGLLENIYLVGLFFPDWKVYAYLGSDVTEEMRGKLASIPSVVVRETGIVGPVNMIHRFFAIDEPDVELMIVRDADSRIHWKDRWAIRQFVNQPQFVGHIIRDNKVHNVRMMGGIWGLRKESGIDVHNEYERFSREPRDHGAGYDQSFLAERIYPRILGRVLVHYSHGLVYPNETGVEFPFAWSNETFCGRPESKDYIERPEPKQELRAQREGDIHRRPFTLFHTK
jgi:hypothetical protein